MDYKKFAVALVAGRGFSWVNDQMAEVLDRDQAARFLSEEGAEEFKKTLKEIYPHRIFIVDPLRIYIKITLPENDPEDDGYVCTSREVQNFVEGMVLNHNTDGEPYSFTFHTVKMSEAEFKNLPRFSGF